MVLVALLLACGGTSSPESMPVDLPSAGLHVDAPAGWTPSVRDDGSVVLAPDPLTSRGRNSLQIWPEGGLVQPLARERVLDGSVELTHLHGAVAVEGGVHRVEAWVSTARKIPEVEAAIGSLVPVGS